MKPTDRLHDLGDFIRQQRENAKKSVRDLARVAGVSNPYLSQIERGIRRPSAEVLQQIARALEISAETLYVRAGILDADVSNVSSVPAAIAADARLSDEQKSTLLSVYRSYVGADVPPGAARPDSVGVDGGGETPPTISGQ